MDGTCRGNVARDPVDRANAGVRSLAKRFMSTCGPEEGFSTLERLLVDLKKWFVLETTPQP